GGESGYAYSNDSGGDNTQTHEAIRMDLTAASSQQDRSTNEEVGGLSTSKIYNGAAYSNHSRGNNILTHTAMEG
ncbi:hypothetical protein Tco_0288663, partial [Tanacetum coccineum]